MEVQHGQTVSAISHLPFENILVVHSPKRFYLNSLQIKIKVELMNDMAFVILIGQFTLVIQLVKLVPAQLLMNVTVVFKVGDC